MTGLGKKQKEWLERFSKYKTEWVNFRPRRGMKPWRVMEGLISRGLIEIRQHPDPLYKDILQLKVLKDK
jgi:hypothetical protein